MIHKLGWRPDTPDIRDIHAPMLAPHLMASLPPAASLRGDFVAISILDQGALGCCVWNAMTRLAAYLMHKQGSAPIQLSRLFGYYKTRVREGTKSEDAGCEIRDAIKVFAGRGSCLETIWPYDISKFTVRPPEQAFADALNHQATAYVRVNNVLAASIKAQIVDGNPVIFGATLYESFESPEVEKTGAVPMPQASEQMLGGHCMLIEGYDDATSRFLVANSWGVGWGDKGYCTIPYLYLTNDNLADDFWVVTAEE